MVGRSDLLDGIDELAEGPGFVRGDPGEVGLVVGVHAGHQFHVRTVRVGQVTFPGPGEFLGAPGEEFLAGGDVVVGHVDQACPAAVIVPAEEVEAGIPGKEGGSHRVVLAPGYVHPLAVIDTVVGAPGDRVAGHGPLGVVGHVGDIRREEELVLVADQDGHVHPPEEGLEEGGAVVELDLEFDPGAAGAQTDADHALGALQGIVVTEPDRATAVVVFLDQVVDRHRGGGPVVQGPVELHAAGDPRPEEADHGRFDHVLAVDEVVPVGPVTGDVDAAPDLGQEHQLQVLVFEPNGAVRAVRFLAGQAVGDGVGIDPAAGPLVDAPLQEHGVRVRKTGDVGGDGHGLFAGHDVLDGVVAGHGGFLLYPE